MKKESGLCTNRLSLCFRASTSAGGCSRSMSACNTCTILKHSPPSERDHRAPGRPEQCDADQRRTILATARWRTRTPGRRAHACKRRQLRCLAGQRFARHLAWWCPDRPRTALDRRSLATLSTHALAMRCPSSKFHRRQHSVRRPFGSCRCGNNGQVLEGESCAALKLSNAPLCLGQAPKLTPKSAVQPGKVVIVLQGRHAGKKAIIVRNYDDGTSGRRYGHALVCGLAKPPRKVRWLCIGAAELAITRSRQQALALCALLQDALGSSAVLKALQTAALHCACCACQHTQST